MVIQFPTRWEGLLAAFVDVAKFFNLVAVNLALVILQVERIGVNLTALVANQLRLGIVRLLVLIQLPTAVAHLAALLASTVDLLAGNVLIDVGLQLFKAFVFSFACYAYVMARIREVYDNVFRVG